MQPVEELLSKHDSRIIHIHQPRATLIFMSRRTADFPDARLCQTRTSTGNHCMQVDVTVQMLIPCVQHHRCSGFELLF
jgi:hypothetical protein